MKRLCALILLLHCAPQQCLRRGRRAPALRGSPRLRGAREGARAAGARGAKDPLAEAMGGALSPPALERVLAASERWDPEEGDAGSVLRRYASLKRFVEGATGGGGRAERSVSDLLFFTPDLLARDEHTERLPRMLSFLEEELLLDRRQVLARGASLFLQDPLQLTARHARALDCARQGLLPLSEPQLRGVLHDAPCVLAYDVDERWIPVLGAICELLPGVSADRVLKRAPGVLEVPPAVLRRRILQVSAHFPAHRRLSSLLSEVPVLLLRDDVGERVQMLQQQLERLSSEGVLPNRRGALPLNALLRGNPRLLLLPLRGENTLYRRAERLEALIPDAHRVILQNPKVLTMRSSTLQLKMQQLEAMLGLPGAEAARAAPFLLTMSLEAKLLPRLRVLESVIGDECAENVLKNAPKLLTVAPTALLGRVRDASAALGGAALLSALPACPHILQVPAPRLLRRISWLQDAFGEEGAAAAAAEAPWALLCSEQVLARRLAAAEFAAAPDRLLVRRWLAAGLAEDLGSGPRTSFAPEVTAAVAAGGFRALRGEVGRRELQARGAMLREMVGGMAEAPVAAHVELLFAPAEAYARMLFLRGAGAPVPLAEAIAAARSGKEDFARAGADYGAFLERISARAGIDAPSEAAVAKWLRGSMVAGPRLRANRE